MYHTLRVLPLLLLPYVYTCWISLQPITGLASMIVVHLLATGAMLY